MILKELNIVNFKNIAQASLGFGDGLNCFVGRNGAGKTNVLDAIYHLSMCKSFFNSSELQNIRHDQPFFVIQGRYGRSGEDLEVYCGVKRGEKKVFKRNGKPYGKLSEHIGLLPLVMVSPEDSVMIDGGSEERRRFMDGMICQCNRNYLGHLIRYNKVLQQRNALLKSCAGRVPDAGILEVWDEQLVDNGGFIMRTRSEFIGDFREIFQRYYEELSSGREKVELLYKASVDADLFADELKRNLGKDSLLGYTSCGIHRDDLGFDIGNYPVRKTGSQGQKKSFLIALKLAQFEWIHEKGKVRPLLLLDDILDKLDSERVRKLMRIVGSEGFGQIFITDTDRGHLDEILQKETGTCRIFEVEEGEIYPL